MKVNFIRKPTREEIVPQDEFVIEKTITLYKESFDEFTNYPLKDYKFIEENVEFMYCDENNVTHCILIKCSGYDYGFLVNSSGHSYGRYVAYMPLKLL